MMGTVPRLLHVLVIDDNPADIKLIDLGYAELGIAIRLSQALDGAIALELLTALQAGCRCPNLILLDLNMPRVSGFEVLQFIRERRLCPHARIIIMSSSTWSGDRERALALGAERFVSKPPGFDELLTLLRDLATPPSASPAESLPCR